MRDKGIKITETLNCHILKNKKEYIIVTLFFIIGIFLGVLFINNIGESSKIEINEYINNFVEKMKQTENLDITSLFKTSLTQNAILAITIWFFGTTVIRNASCIWNSNI